MHTQMDMDVMAHHTLQDLMEMILAGRETDRLTRSDLKQPHADKF